MSERFTKKPILSARQITKTFPGVIALKDVNLDIYPGEVHAIVGENGAGKSTLMKILSGVYSDFEGELTHNGQSVRYTHPGEAQGQGITIIHQELFLIPELNIAENIFLGREPLTKLGLIDFRRMEADTIAMLKKLDMPVDPGTPVRDLRVGQQQVVEIAKALSQKANIFIMDEPTSAISEHEIDVLFNLIESLKSEGVAILYITHKLDELFRIADRLTVLRDGELIHSGTLDKLTPDDIVRLMVGRDLTDFFIKTKNEGNREIFSVSQLSVADTDHPDMNLLENISFSIRQGEVLGLFGLMGAGRTELLESIFGLRSDNTCGQVWVDQELTTIRSPEDAIRQGLALVPEDRKQDGLIMGLSVSDNITLPCLSQTESMGFLNGQNEHDQTARFVKRMNIRIASPKQDVNNLSGGNQQKVVIAKWMATHPKVLMLDEPTRGIDVGAKSEIYGLISDLSGSGMGILLVSSDLPEILAIADRILVLSEGRITGEFDPKRTTEEFLLKAAIPKSL